ncbi:LPS assembly lipoprotein LptE [Psychromonas aquatilis]|uniref:LPS-assembly lipoprotein LptE n=1 Tax=Psychromonas aquatilis TaxID=2005072 RepID=A0ABU9GQL2_9GAMM
MHSLSSQAFYRKATLIMAFVSTLVLTGCGFHLKENNGLVEKFPEVYLQTPDPKSDLTRLMKLRLRGANIKILTQPSPDVAVIHLISESQTERTISLYANAQNAEKEIGYTMKYSLKMPNYTAKNFSVNLYRDFLYNSNQALAKSREAELLLKELRVIAADHVITNMLSIKNEATE